MVNIMADLMSIEPIHPVRNGSLSMPQPVQDDVMEVEQVAQVAQSVPLSIAPQQAQNIGNIVDAPVAYINQSICATPKLASNQTLTLPSNLQSAIAVFRDQSKDTRTRASSQRLVERYLVERGSCSNLNPTIMQDFRLRLFGIDSDILDSVLASENTLNANVHDNLACAVDAIIYDGKLPGTLAPSQRERVRNWFPSIKQIGQESIEGYALKTSFTTNTNMFVMKAPRNPKNDELVHEALIGFYALNKLRHVLPNYMYVYGYVKCSPPAIENKEVATWCSSSNPAVSYLIAENIRDAVSIGEFLTDPATTALDVIVVFYQIMNALNLAYKTYGYTHYDLHYGNIMVRKYPKVIAIPYFGTDNKVIGYLASQYVPYIIDYGYSRITVAGIGFGKIGLESAGIEGERPFPMYDTYKILGFLGERLYTQSRTSHYAEISRLLETLFSFFGDGTLFNRVQRRLAPGARDWYSAQPQYRSLTHDNYISWMQNGSGIPIPVHVNLLTLISQGVYTAPINTSLDTCAFYNMVTSGAGPETSLEYCEVIDAINADSILAPNIKQDAIDWLNSVFDAEQYFTNSIASRDAMATEVNNIIQRRKLSGTNNMVAPISGVTNLTTATFVDTYRSHILDLLRIKDLDALLISYTKSAICALASQGKFQIHKDRLEALNKFNNDLTNYINAQRSILKQNLAYAKSVNWASRVSDRRILSFWTTEHENLILAL